jgi:hypothetical protein
VANVRQGNKIFIDSAGVLMTTRAKITYIIFTPDGNNDMLELKETQAGPVILKVQAATANTTVVIDVVHCPLVFQNGIYVESIDSGSCATLVLTEGGAT